MMGIDACKALLVLDGIDGHAGACLSWAIAEIGRLTAERDAVAFEEKTQRHIAEAALAERDRLQRIETAVKALTFSAYPAHGTGYVMTVNGNLNDLLTALHQPDALIGGTAFCGHSVMKAVCPVCQGL